MARTQRQILANKLVNEDGLSRKEAGKIMGISARSIGRLLLRYKQEVVRPRHTPRQERAYRLLYVEGVSRKAAAELMGITPQGVSRLVTEMMKRYPSLRVCRKKPTTVRVNDWSRFNQTKIVDVY